MWMFNCFSSAPEEPPAPPPSPPEIRVTSPIASRGGSVDSVIAVQKSPSNPVIITVGPQQPASSSLLDSDDQDDILITKRGSGEVLVLSGALSALEHELERVEKKQEATPNPESSSPKKRQSTKRVAKKASKKLFFIWSLAAYCVCKKKSFEKLLIS